MKIILLGDSITQGLGSKKINFVNELNRLLPTTTILNWALTGTTIGYAAQLLPQILDEKPNFVVVLYGNVDAQLKPNRKGKIFKHLPKRFQGGNGSMILPRPFYSSKWYKRYPQYVENILRTIFRNLIFKTDGVEQWVSYPDFMNYYKQLLRVLQQAHISTLACSTVYIDENLWPGTVEQYKKYNAGIATLCKQKFCPFIDIYTLFYNEVKKNGWEQSYNFDHFHPNGNGYKLLAGWLAQNISKEK